MSKINDGTIYLGDNGRAYCGAHLGMTAKATGRDIGGQPIMAVTPDMMMEPYADMLCCEQCGRKPSRLWAA